MVVCCRKREIHTLETDAIERELEEEEQVRRVIDKYRHQQQELLVVYPG